MKLLLQILLAGLLVSLLTLSIRRNWVERAATEAPAARAVWQQGLWSLQDRLAETVRAHAAAAAPTPARPYRVAVRVDTSAAARHRFSGLAPAALAAAIEEATFEIENLVFLPADTRVLADLTLTVTLSDYAPGEEADLLTGTVTVMATDGKPEETSFEARCPAEGRDWFVRNVCPPDWTLLGAVALMLLGAAIGVWGAYDSFKGDYRGSWRMLGAIPVLGLGAYLLLAFVCEPGMGRIGIPRRHVRIALDSSDAVRFSPMPGSALPVPATNPGGPDEPEPNELCAFVNLCVARIEGVMQIKTGPETRGGFLAWLRDLFENMDPRRRHTDLLSVSEGLDIAHGFALHGETPDESAPEVADLFDLPGLLAPGHRGAAPGFFLPWTGAGEKHERELVVALMTAEPASRRQALWLRDHRHTLRELQLPGVQVLGVLLPAIARSEHPEWTAAARLRNAAAVSDALITLDAADPDTAAAQPGAQVEIEHIPVFRPDPGIGDEAPADPDALRTLRFRADPDAMNHAAERIAERVRGMAEVRETAVFQAPPAGLWVAIVMAACLALFLGLQRELRLLDNDACAWGRFQTCGAVLSLGGGLFVALLLGYAVAEPARWRTITDPLTVLWALTTLWYAGIWLPLLLGRRLGELPRPTRTIDTVWLFRLYLGCMAGMLLVVAACLYKRFVPGRSATGLPFGLCGGHLALLPAALFILLPVVFGCIGFYRESRRRVFWSGYIGLAILCVLPWLGPWALDRLPLTNGFAAAWAAVLPVAGLIALPAMLASFAARRTRPLERALSMGWYVVPGALAGLALSLSLYWPSPVGRGVVWADLAVAQAPAAVAAVIGLWTLVWLIGVWRECRG